MLMSQPCIGGSEGVETTVPLNCDTKAVKPGKIDLVDHYERLGGHVTGSNCTAQMFPLATLVPSDCRSHKLNQHDFRTRAHSQWRSPSARTARCVHQHLAEALQPIGKLLVHSFRQPGPRKELPAMRVSR